MTIGLLFVAMAVAALLWPGAKKPLFPSLPSLEDVVEQPSHATPSYQDAIHSLAHVRLRLLMTDHLTDDTRKAVAQITQALVDGSDQT